MRFGIASITKTVVAACVLKLEEEGLLSLDDAIAAEVTPYLSCAPQAVAAAKGLARRLGPVIDTAAVTASIDALIAQWEGNEANEGIAAFFEKRAPRWQVG